MVSTINPAGREGHGAARAFARARRDSSAAAQVDLNGSWEFKAVEERAWLPATVPGSVQSDLISNGRLADPYFRDNELQAQWVGERDWEYRRRFPVQRELLDCDAVVLECLGLDTVAEIYLNEAPLARTANMFREYEFDVRARLKAGENTLRLLFRSPLAWCREVDRADPRVIWQDLKSKAQKGYSSFLRKEACDFGWDWGLRLVRSGIWRPIRLAAYNTARITALTCSQLWEGGKVRLELAAEVQRYRKAVPAIRARLALGAREIACAELSASGERACIQMEIPDPQLWWPNGLGEQPLYDLQVELLDGGAVVHSRQARIGLREVELVRERDGRGESFGLAVNGELLFCKGANWVPADALPERLTVERYRSLLHSCRAAHMNMLRLWGGGRYEADIFYDLCDELGIMLWHDFMFAEGPYLESEEYLDNIREEIRTQVRRLAHHPSIVLWCGNNESESNMTRGHKWLRYETVSWSQFDRIFGQLIPQALAEYDPQRPYWPSSPHHPLDREGKSRDWESSSGDAHIWEVWHDLEPPSYYEKGEGYRFVSEFGLQSLPVMETIRSFTRRQDRRFNSPVMEHHQKAADGTSKLCYYVASRHRVPSSLENWVYLTQVVQAEIMKIGVEAFRRNYPRTTGALYWQLDNNWPAQSGCSIDYYGRWNALHYLACRFFAPVLVSASVQGSTAAVWGINDLRRDLALVLRWTLLQLGGASVLSGEREVSLPANRSTLLERLSFAEALGEDLQSRTDRKEGYEKRGSHCLLLALSQDGKQLSSNVAFFLPPKFLRLPNPRLILAVQKESSPLRLSVTAAAFAAYTEIGLRRGFARFSDNYFHLLPGETREIRLLDSETAQEEIPEQLYVRTLFDAR